MCDTALVSRLYASVLHEEKLEHEIHDEDIREAINNMKEVYMPNPQSMQSSSLNVADYNDPAHRCAYLHKYAPFHTAMVAEFLSTAIAENPNFYRDLVSRSGKFNICSLGAGPGNDVIATLSVLNSCFGYFETSACNVDYFSEWKLTFRDIVEELRYGPYGALGEMVSTQYFDWTYIGANLLAAMSPEVHKAITSANLITMVKFLSAAACKDSSAMIKKIFRTIKQGAIILYIDNAGGGFHQMVREAAQECQLYTVFGPLKHFHYKEDGLNVKRFGYTPCLETTVTVQIWTKLHPNQKGIIVDPQSITLKVHQAPPGGRSTSGNRMDRSRSRSRNRNNASYRNRPAQIQRNARGRQRITQWEDCDSDSEREKDTGCCVIL